MKDAVVMKLDNATRMLAEAKTIQQAKKIMDMADAAKVYARQQQLGQDATDYANSIKIEAMRRLGQLWKDAPKHPGTRVSPLLGGSQEKPPSRLSELGINKKLAHLSTKLAELPKEEYEQVRDGIVGMAEALRQAKRTSVISELESVKNKEVKKLAGKYDVVVIDPPWPMQKIDRDVRPNQTEFDYPTMSGEEIADVRIPASDDCHLWLWTTHRFMPMAFRLLDVWSFKYVCTFVWHKPGGFQPIGLPQYNCEFALYARKGTPSFIDTKAFPTCFEAPRGKHSEKPDSFYEMICRVTAGRRVDMFNRREIEGFDTWGNQAA